jgi:serine/threonine protein kinase/lipoprotein NlpI
MTPERWKQIDELFQAVIEQPPSERSAFLDAACGDDKALRDEIDSLISFQEQAETFLEAPAFEASSAFVCATAFTSMTGQIIGPYRIERPLGVGGMGEVYLAEHIKLEKKVAIKFLPPYLQTDEAAKRRLLREAQAAAKLEHPGICAVYEVNDETDQSFIVMQYVDGETLADRIKSRPLDLREAVDITIQIAEALTEAHSRGIVHRDIKPGNVMITPRGQVKVLDFGLAKAVDTQSAASVSIDNQLMLSRPGDRPGTPPYMSPEQARGKPVDARGDLFAVGVILYECIAGTRPFVGNTTSEILDQIRVYNPPPPSNFSPGIPTLLDSIVLKALAKRSRDRYQSAVELLEDLHAVRSQLDFRDPLPTIPMLGAREPTRWSSAWTTISNVVGKRRALVSVTALVFCLAIGMITVAIVGQFRQPYHPTAAALRSYNIGTTHLRNGAYFEASKALQEAVKADDKFALAHARLAEAYTELDYSDKAKDEIIRAERLVRELRMQQSDALYLRALTNMVLRDFGPAVESYQQIAREAAAPDKANVYLDLGRAYEKNDQLKEARENYKQATTLAPQDPAGFLRLGVVCGQSQDYVCAFDALQNAESLYQALSSNEGVTEVLYQRGFLLIYQVKLPEARTQLEKSLEIARAIENQYQLIRVLQLLSTVSALEGHIAQAEQQATEALQLAQTNGIENQATRGLIFLGTAFLWRGDYTNAEKYYLQGLALAQRDKMQVSEAWALTQLGSLRSLQHKPEEALHYAEKALAFYRQRGYRKWLSLTLPIVGRAYRDRGEYESALKLFEDQVKLGEQLGDQFQVAIADLDIGNVLSDEEQYPNALQSFDKSYKIFKSLKADSYIAYAAQNRASVLWQLGRSAEASEALREASSITEGREEANKQLLAYIHLTSSLLELSDGHLAESKVKSRKALEVAGNHYIDVAIQAKQTLAKIQVRSGAGRAAKILSAAAINMANGTADPQLIYGALLASAEAMLVNSEAQAALKVALRAQQSFARYGKQDSEWRAWLIAAQASHRLGKNSAAHEYALNANARLTDLEQRWGSEAYSSYIARPDRAQLRNELNDLLKP